MRTTLAPTRRPLVSALLALAAVTACETATSPPTDPSLGTAAAAKRVNAQKLVPFTDRQSIQAAGGSIDCGPIGVAPAILVGSGVSSHLGRITSVSTWESCELFAGDLVVTGTMTTTAANGDEITATFDMTFPALVPGEPNDFVIDLTIVGGTGRFAGVTGFAAGQGTTAPPGRGEWELRGWMTPPGVSKHATP